MCTTLVRDDAPKVRVITDNLVETSHVVRSKAQEFDVTLTDVNQRRGKQVAHVDGMVTSVLDTTSNLRLRCSRTIQMPVREVAGLVNGLKAGLDVLVGKVKGFGWLEVLRMPTTRNPMDGRHRSHQE